jgi:hypothetical protein
MEDFPLIGGDLALDFLNTVADRLAEPRERLATGADVDRWARCAGLLGPRESLRLGPRAVARVRAAREDLYAVLQPLTIGHTPGAAALARFNGALARGRVTPPRGNWWWPVTTSSGDGTPESQRECSARYSFTRQSCSRLSRRTDSVNARMCTVDGFSSTARERASGAGVEWTIAATGRRHAGTTNADGELTYPP